MVFRLRCFSFEYEAGTQTQSTTSETFYTALSDVNRPTFVLHELNSAEKPGGNNHLRVFTVTELKAATRNFKRAWNIGEGGFGSVYKGVIKSLNHPFDEIQVAVKYAKEVGHGIKEWLAEVNVLGVVEHQNLVKLVGYCVEEGEKGIQLFLVYEYMPNGSLKDHLSIRSKTPLSWAMRLKVAQDTARALTYLHEQMDFQIILRDFKASNILLDDEWNAKLSDFGAARLGPQQGHTHILTAFVGTMAYAAPEYIQVGRLSSKSDVWSYGVFLYELITGRQALDKNRPKNEQLLLEWVRPYLHSNKLKHIIDPRVEGMCSLKSAQNLVNIANLCLYREPESRPKMSEVLEMVNGVIEGVPSQVTTNLVDIDCKNVVTTEKTREDTTHEGERGSIGIQLTESASLPAIRNSKPLKYWFRKKHLVRGK